MMFFHRAINADRSGSVWVRELLVVGTLVGAFLTLLFVVRSAAPTSFDRWFAGQIQAIDWGNFAFIPAWGSELGGGIYGFYVVPAIAAGVFAAMRRWRLVLLVAAVFALHYLLISPKLFITAYRPSPIFGVEGAGGLESFPSGHVQWAVSFYGLIAYVGWRSLPERYRYAVLPAYAALVLATMLGRIELGRHWPIDTLAGVLAGLIALRLLIALYAWPGARLRLAPARN